MLQKNDIIIFFWITDYNIILYCYKNGEKFVKNHKRLYYHTLHCKIYKNYYNNEIYEKYNVNQ